MSSTTSGSSRTTIIYYIIGDNGAVGQGTMNGAFHEMANFNGMAAVETPEFMVSELEHARRPRVVQPLLGRLGVGDEHAAAVDEAGRVRHWGGTRNGTIVHWPNGIEERVDCVRSSPMSSTSRRRSSRPPGCPNRPW